jgi:ketosteroid isomerase-like protein
MATGEGALNPKNPTPPDPAADQPAGLTDNPEIEEFFHRLPSNLRWPKPSAEAVAAAVEAVQRMAGSPSRDEPPADGATSDSGAAAGACTGCGQPVGPGIRFCGYCGLAVQAAAAATPGPAQPASGAHHYHHHYHHFVPAQGMASGAAAGEGETIAPRGRASAPGSSPTTGSRAETAVRQLVQDWAQACNIKHLDDLVELYSSDATLIRSNVPPVRSLPAIREFLFALLEAGLGDVEMESLRTEVFGEIAFELGRCKMLVPVAMGKRREERGKYLVVMARQPAGHWKIMADCWSTDLNIASPVEPPHKSNEAGAPPKKGR